HLSSSPALPILLFFQLTVSHSALPSFPTRRSSDLDPGTIEPRGIMAYVLLVSAFKVRNPVLALILMIVRTGLRTLNADTSNTYRSEEHTSELQSLTNLVCRLLLEKKKTRHHSGATS